MGYHPNIHQAYYTVKIYDGKVYPLTELIDTVTLKGKHAGYLYINSTDWIYNGEGYLYEDYPHQSTRKVLNVLLQIALGMAHLHEKGFVHSSLRP